MKCARSYHPKIFISFEKAIDTVEDLAASGMEWGKWMNLEIN